MREDDGGDHQRQCREACVATTATSRPWFSFSRLCDNASEVEPFFSLLVVSVIVFGAIVFAAFLGHVTTMIQSYEKSNALYRDGMTSMHHFFELPIFW